MNRCRLAVPGGRPIQKYPDRIQATLPLDDRLGHGIQHSQPFLSVLHARSPVPAAKIRRNQEHAGVELAVSVSELKKNPTGVMAGAAGGMPVAVLNHNRVMGYMVSAELYEQMMERLDDLDLVEVIKARSG